MGEFLFRRGFYLLAKETLEAHLRLYPRSPFQDSVNAYLEKIRTTYLVPTAEKIITEGDELYAQRRWAEALDRYIRALAFEYQTPLLQRKIESSQEMIAKEVLNSIISRGDELYAQGNWKGALALYTQAAEITQGPGLLQEKIETTKAMSMLEEDPLKKIKLYIRNYGVLLLKILPLLLFAGAALYIYKKKEGNKKQHLKKKRTEFNRKRKEFRAHDAYKYLEDFVEKYVQGAQSQDVVMLQQLLAQKGFEFTQGEIDYLIKEKRDELFYQGFKNQMLSNNPQELNDYIVNFLVMYPDKFGEYLGFLQTLLIERNISYGRGQRELAQKIDNFKKEKEIAHFEEKLRSQEK